MRAASPLLRIALILCLLNHCYGVKFLVYGDWGSQSQPQYAPTQIAVANQMEKTVAENNVSFVISTGDNFYESGVTSTDDPHFVEDFVNVYKPTGALNCCGRCVTPSPQQGSVQAQIDYKGDPRWYMPDKNYTWTVDIGDEAGTTATFVVLDTTPFIQSYFEHPQNDEMRKQLEKENWRNQLLWLNETLRSITSQWVIVVGHHPMYSRNQWNEHGGAQELRDYVQPLLEDNRVIAFFSGHEHDLQHLVSGPKTSTGRRTLHHIISGAAARIELKPQKRDIRDAEQLFHSDQPGFVLVDLQTSHMTCTFINHKGDNLYEVRIPLTDASGEDPAGRKLPLSIAILLGIVGAIVLGVIIVEIVLYARKQRAASQGAYTNLLDEQRNIVQAV